jgi:hypothetical protein
LVVVRHPVSPLRRFGLVSKLGGVGCALSERVARVAQPPNLLANPKVPVGRRGGVAFSWLSSFGEAKEVTRSPGGPGIKSIMHEVHSEPIEPRFFI